MPAAGWTEAAENLRQIRRLVAVNLALGPVVGTFEILVLKSTDRLKGKTTFL